MKTLVFAIILNLLKFSLSSQNKGFDYNLIENVGIISSIHESKLIASFKIQKEKYSFLRECNKDSRCLSCSFDTLTSDCFLYNFTSKTSDYTAASGLSVFTKRVQQSAYNFLLLSHFQNPVLKFSVTTSNGMAFIEATSAEMVIDNGYIYYFASDYQTGKVIKHDSTWRYLTSVSIVFPRTVKWGKNALFVSSSNRFYKLDYNLNILKSIVDNNAVYNGVYFNSTDDTLYTCVWYRNRIDIFDLDLNSVGNISMGTYSPIGINGFQGLLYVSVNPVTAIFVMQNREIIKTITISTSVQSYIYTILFDDYGYMALTFQTDNIVKLYHVNGSYTGLYISFSRFAYNINYDFDRNFMITAYTGIYFY